jgi:hypothetical protein
MIDGINEILGKDFEIIINSNEYDERMFNLVDKTGTIGPYSSGDTIDVNKWLPVLGDSLKLYNWKKSSRHYERMELLLSLLNKVKRIRKINELLNIKDE